MLGWLWHWHYAVVKRGKPDNNIRRSVGNGLFRRAMDDDSRRNIDRLGWRGTVRERQTEENDP